MASPEEQQQYVSALIKEAVTVLCKSKLKYEIGIEIEGEINITIDMTQGFNITLKELIGFQQLIIGSYTVTDTGKTIPL